MNEGFIRAAKLARQRADKEIDPEHWKDCTSKAERYYSKEMFLDELSQKPDIAWKSYVSRLSILLQPCKYPSETRNAYNY
jgi:hypothetical protein